MQGSTCNGSTACLHGEDANKGDEDSECDVEESDPTRRFIRHKEVLGRGAFKTVYRGFDEVDGIEVAWNQIKLQDVLRSPEDLERLYSEVHLLKTLKHKNIIKFYHSWVDMKTNRINFITEFFTSGTLRQYRKRHKHVDIKAVKNWCRQILRGLLYLHSHDPPIIHRDLKCDNIFINGNHGEVKIGDLGLATILCQAHAAHSVIGTPEFMAPELYEEEYTELVDIYSFGMCLLEMVTFEYPYSECSNAAQIYKKVSSGIKPAALDKLKDLELHQFVEKCLAPASKRLPARELLMDPFLRCDRDRDPVDLPPVLGRTVTKSLEFEDFGELLHKASLKPTFGQREAKSSLNISRASMAPAVGDLKYNEPIIPKNPIKPLISSDLKEDKSGRNMDFRLKGKRRENDIVYLRLWITAEGLVRIIHFPFDVEGDSAMCVASEMVQELDLADQDVTKIAEMIDAAVLVMVPEWKPGVAIDERCEGEEDPRKEPVQDDHLSMSWSSDVSTSSSGSSLTEQFQHRSLPAVVLAVPPQKENTVHGRFEEVMFHHRRLEHLDHAEEEHCTVTTQSSEDLGDWEPTDESSSSDDLPVSSALKCDSGAAHASYGMTHRGAATVFNGLLESNVGCHGDPSNSYSGGMADWALYQNDVCGENHLKATENPDGFDDNDNSERFMQEMKDLTLRHEQELKELQHKHEEARLELRKQWRDKRAALCVSETQQSGSATSNDEEVNGIKEQVLNMQGYDKFLEKVSRNCSGNVMQSREQSGRLSFKELASLLGKVDPLDDPGSFKVSTHDSGSSKVSADDLGSFKVSVDDLGSLNVSVDTVREHILNDVMSCPPSKHDFAEDIALVNGLTSNYVYKVVGEKSLCHKYKAFRGTESFSAGSPHRICFSGP